MINVRLKLAKAKQHPGVELLLFENDWYFSSMLSSKSNTCSKKFTEKKCVYFDGVISFVAMKMRLKIKNRT